MVVSKEFNKMEEKIISHEELKRKEYKTQDILVNLDSYLELASSYIDNNDNNRELFNLGILIENMQKELGELMKMYGLQSKNLS